MAIELLHKLIYALISGIVEFFPVSAPAHQLLYEQITGWQMSDPGLTFAIHVGCLAALLLGCKNQLSRLRRERHLAKFARRRNSRKPDPAALMDLKLLKIGAIPVLISILFYRLAGNLAHNPAILALFLLGNSALLFIPRLLSQGNKDGRSLSGLDAILMGLGGVLSVIPGFSRVGGITSSGLARGAERSYALDFALLLSIPALIGMVIFDVYGIAAAGIVLSLTSVLGWVIGLVASFGAGYLGIVLIRFLFAKTGCTSFAYYSLGLALVSFVLYLIV